jgi:outer membrane receptor protein involved in Fe transport
VRQLYLLLFFTFLGKNVQSQNALAREITADYQDITLIEILLDLEKRYPPMRFYYEPNVLPYYKIKYKSNGTTVFDALQNILPNNDLVCATTGDEGIVICRKSDLNRPYITRLLAKWDEGKIEMPEFLQPYALSLDCGTAPRRAGMATVTGQVLDEQTREPIAGAVLRLDPPLRGGATTNSLGQFSLQVQAADSVLARIDYPGYRLALIHLRVYGSGEVSVPIQQRFQSLQEVVIQGNRAADKTIGAATGLDLLPARIVKELPAFAGEADVVKSLSVLPGVSTVGEGASGFNVRGGNIDQNLVLQDGLPFFNTSHVLGFFSVFNPDLVGSTTLHKGHIPASYGGRTASVLDVQLRNPNFRQWSGNAGLGLLTAKVNLEGPIVRDRVAVLMGGRTSYSDWLLKRAKLPTVKASSARFADATAKVVTRLNTNGSLELTGHTSTDFFRFGRDFGYSWSTNGGSATYRQALSERWVVQAQVAMGQLRNTYFTPDGFDAFELSSGLRYARGRSTATWVGRADHEARIGAEWNRSVTLPQMYGPRTDSSFVVPQTVQQGRGEEWAAFVEDDWKITPRLSLYAGLRWSQYRQLGGTPTFAYEPGAPAQVSTIVDTIFFEKNKTVQTYGGAEPRVALGYQVASGLSVKASYNRLRQYLHLISNTTAATPADIWQVSTRYIAPQVGDNYGAGIFWKNAAATWESSFEGFWKKTQNVAGYRDFADLLLNEHLETELVPSRMRSYGLEYALKKNEGKLTGWLAYTWSRSWQQTRSEFPSIQVNRGAWFPANFDQPHQLNLFAKFGLNPARYWTFNFTYRTGRPVSAPGSSYQTGNVVLPYFPERNNFRIRDYHRLDVAFTIDKNKSKIEGLRWIVNLSVYNVYARENPFAVYFQRDKQGLTKAYQLSAIGAAIPTANVTLVF